MVRQADQFYAVVSDWNGIVASSIASGQKRSVEKFLAFMGSGKSWPEYEKDGMRCVKVKVSELKNQE